MLITPERSENNPPSAARINGVASLIIDATSDHVKTSLIRLRPQPPESKPAQRPFEERLSSDKQNDDSLQHLHDVFRDVLGKTVDVDPAMLEHGKQQRGEYDADRMIASEQSDGDSSEAVVIGEAVVVTIAITHDFVDPHHARERTGHGHREHDLFANRNTAVLRRRRIASGRAYFIAPLRVPQKQIDQQTTKQRQQKREIQRNAFRQTGNKLAEPRDVGAPTDRRAFQNRIALFPVVILREITDQRDGDEVQHDRVDYFVRTKI